MTTGQPIILRPDLIRKRHAYLSAIEQARASNHCLIYMDETWVFDCMSKKRSWEDTTIARFAPAAVLQEYSCGRAMTKNKGKRAIVISAISREGIIPESTKIIISGMRSVEQDYHRDMNHEIYENWIRDTITHMKRIANGRCVSLIVDNAPYHSRQAQKLPSQSSTKAEIASYLRSNDVAVAENSNKTELLEKLNEFMSSRGGRDGLRKYVVDGICADLEVRRRALDWLRALPASQCARWMDHVVAEENAARQKIVIDREASIQEDWGSDVSILSDEEISDAGDADEQ
ncbi:unnamed protein product [Cylicocyclus nassatus]|uniref:Tc1-like transposase DDE domain-containing protein n=1 Tax=Cylicocyclus nassatus TaxID=53992 RepID=A0AA36GXR6_CYLNA|nr:unnamed protein product [Cylicocyclus nassatus]